MRVPSARHLSTVNPSPSKLDDIVRLDQLADKTAEEISHIWTEYHEQQHVKGSVGTILTVQDYNVLLQRAKQRYRSDRPAGVPGTGFV